MSVAGERRPDELRELVGAHHERVAALELLALEQPRQRGLGGRHEEPGDDAEADAPARRPSRAALTPVRTVDGERAGEHEAQRVGDEHDGARRVPVGERAADEHHSGPRDAGERQDEAELERVVRERQHEPRQGDEVELVAEMRDAPGRSRAAGSRGS